MHLYTSIQELKLQLGHTFILSDERAIEFVSQPTPFTADIFSKINSYDGSLGIAYRRIGINIREYSPDLYSIYLNGRLFNNLEVENHFLYEPLGLEYVAIGDELRLVTKDNGFKSLYSQFVYSYRQARILSNLPLLIDELDKKVDLVAKTSELAVGGNTLSLLKREISLFIDRYSYICEAAIIANILTMFIEGKLDKDENIFRLLNLYKGKRPNNYVASSQAFLSGLTVEQVLEQYGNRSFTDFEFASKRWNEQPEKIAQLITKKQESVNPKLITPKNFLDNQLKQHLLNLNEIITCKDNLRFAILSRVSRIRELMLKLGNIHGLEENIFYLTIDEINEIDTNKNLIAIAEKCRQLIQEQIKVPMPSLITIDTEIDQHGSLPVGNQLLVASPGVARGKIQFIDDSDTTINPGSILVLPTASPEYAHLLPLAKGIIFLSGGILSHSAIIVRELNIPAVFCTNLDYLRKFKDEVLLNAEKGNIEQL